MIGQIFTSITGLATSLFGQQSAEATHRRRDTKKAAYGRNRLGAGGDTFVSKTHGRMNSGQLFLFLSLLLISFLLFTRNYGTRICQP